MKRRGLAAATLALSLAPMTALAQTSARAPAEPFLFTPPDVDLVHGAVGVCVRWGEADGSHVSDVVIVESSGDAKIDAEAPAMIRSIPWPTPMGYQGEWMGLSVSFTGAPPRAAEPDCETLMKAQPLPPEGASL
jgi:hypothetical protein